MKVAIIGAAGHVGFPFSCVTANAGHTVYGIDRNENLVADLNKCIVPYVEENAQTILTDNINKKRLFFTTDSKYIRESDVVAIMIGTPVDGEGNARLDDLFSFIDDHLISYMSKGQLIILRSTVSPGTTEVLRRHINNKLQWQEGNDYHLVFCPERVVQGRSIIESTKLPQIVGAFSKTSFEVAKNFFKSFVNNEIFFLTPKEAEIGKLMTNMYRYVNFALANEFWMIGEQNNVNIHKVIAACNYNYIRMDMPQPGPNVGGPCLFKDGKFLLSHIPFADLINTSFHINEGMPDYIFNVIKGMNPQVSKVLILGLTFKKDSDDIRNSLSFKMRKVCKKHGVLVDLWDPFIETNIVMKNSDYDAVIIMTPHTNTNNHWSPAMFRKDCIIADIWKIFPASYHSNSGIYKVGDLK